MGRLLRDEVPRVLVRVSIALLLYEVALRIPWPGALAHWIGLMAGGLLAAAFLIICGTFLYNTLFYDHYWRSVDTRR